LRHIPRHASSLLRREVSLIISIICLAPAIIGPGAYLKDKGGELAKGRSKKEVSFGTDQRFKMPEDLKEFPGPGNYKD